MTSNIEGMRPPQIPLVSFAFLTNAPEFFKSACIDFKTKCHLSFRAIRIFGELTVLRFSVQPVNLQLLMLFALSSLL